MKIRIQGNSIRFRLKQTEVKHFREEGEIKETTSFGILPADKFSFVLKGGSSDNFKITFQSNTVMVEVPVTMCEAWTTTDLVGAEGEINACEGDTIKILVEKDFKCMDGSDDNNKDAYPNPNKYG